MCQIALSPVSHRPEFFYFICLFGCVAGVPSSVRPKWKDLNHGRSFPARGSSDTEASQESDCARLKDELHHGQYVSSRTSSLVLLLLFLSLSLFAVKRPERDSHGPSVVSIERRVLIIVFLPSSNHRRPHPGHA